MAVFTMAIPKATTATAAPGQPGSSPVPVVRIPFPHEDGSLTPYTFELGYPLVTLVYDTLLWRDRDGVPQPWLAKSVETDGGGKRLTIHLADGAHWQDGPPVTSADVAFTFRFIADHPHPRFTSQLQAIAKIETPDAARVVITLRHPSPGFADQPLADVPILPAHIWKTLPAASLAPPGLPVGSGPYRLVDHKEGQSYRFEADPTYFRGPPRVTSIEVPIIGDAEATFRALEQHNADMVPVTLSKQLNDRMRNLSVKVVEGPSYLGTVLLFNVRQPPFDRVEVRRAVSQAIDLERMRNIVGESVAADHGYLHPASPWAPPDVLHSFDEAAARRALATLGVPPIEVLVPDNDPVKAEAGRQAALAMVRAGLTATSRPVPRDQLSKALGEDGSNPSFTAAIGVSPPLASFDPDFLVEVFGSDPARAFLNSTGYASPQFDAAETRLASLADPVARKAAVLDALRLLANDAPVVPLFFQTGSFVFLPNAYDGWVFVKGTGIFDKRSFVDAGPAPPPPTSTTRPGSVVGPSSSVAFPPTGKSSDGLPIGLIGLGLIAVAAVVAVVTLIRR